MTRQTRYSPEVRERSVRMVCDHQGEYASEWEAIRSIADKISCSPETLRKWVRRAQVDTGHRDGITSDEQARIKDLEREVRELRVRMKFFARHRRFSHRRSSTADRRDGVLR